MTIAESKLNFLIKNIQFFMHYKETFVSLPEVYSKH